MTEKTIRLRSTGSDINSLSEALGNDFSKEELRNILSSFKSVFTSTQVETSTMILSEKYGELVEKKFTSTKKHEFSLYVAMLLMSDEAMNAYMRSMPSKAADLFRAVYRNIYVSLPAAKDIFGREAATRRKGSGYFYNNIIETDRWLSMMKYESMGTWGNSFECLTIPSSIRARLGACLTLPAPEITTLSQPVTGNSDILYSTCAEAEPLYPLMHNLYLSGILEMGKSRVTATTLKRISKQVSFKEFFPDESNKALKGLAGTLATSLFCLNASNSLGGRKAVPEPPHVVARQIVSFIRNSSAPILGFFAGLILNKVPQAAMATSNFSLLLKDYFTALKLYARDSWLTTDGLEEYIRNTSSSPRNLFIFNPYQVVNLPIGNEFSGRHLTPASIIPQLTMPLLRMLTGALAALGIVETVYRKDPVDGASPLDGIKSFRLTSMGEFAIGLTEEYTSSIISTGPLFEFDDQRLIMRALGDNNPYELIIQNYLEPIGSHRFTTSPEAFLKGCSEMGGLKKKISNFRQLVGDSLPPLWNDFLDNLTSKSRSIKYSDEDYNIFRIDPSDTSLVSAISSDPELRSLTICAEGYLLLVRASDMYRFEARMRQFGYMV